MSNLLQPYASPPDWRAQLRANDRRTKMVLALFILLYLILGLVLDLALIHPTLNYLPPAEALKLLGTCQVLPIATLTLGVIALGAILVTYSCYDRIMLLGTQYRELTMSSCQTPAEQQLYHLLEELQIAAGLRYLPRLYLIDAEYMNAFASGYSEKSALIAVTKGLLNKLTRSELQAVLAHELSHIRHHDIKLTLMASVLTNIMLIALDLLFQGVLFGNRDRRRQDQGGGGLMMVILILRAVLPLLTVILLCYLSRKREFMADAGAVALTRDNTPLAQALLKISQDHQRNQASYAASYHATAHEEVRATSYLFNPKEAGIALQTTVAELFATHPPLPARLEALGFQLATKEPNG